MIILEYDASANTDDGSCATLVVFGTDDSYLEYDASQIQMMVHATLVVFGCTDDSYLEYDVTNTDDGYVPW